MVLLTLDRCRKAKMTGLLCTEAASGYWGLSSYDYFTFPVYMCEGIHGVVEHIVSNISLVCIPEKVSYEDTVDIGDGIFVTNKIRTVCDFLKYGGDEFHKLETIFNFYCFESEEDIAELERRVAEMGMLDTLYELRAVAEQAMEEG